MPIILTAALLCLALNDGGSEPLETGLPEPPPAWALLERHLLMQLYPAALEFVERYTGPDGTLIWRREWPGMDGSDDGYESFYNFPLYYHWQDRNPVVLEGLVQLMLGGPNHIYHGGLLHARLRYFDPQGKRSGVPPDVAALVDRITPDEVGVQLVNLHPSQARSVIIQAGLFGEHVFTRVRYREFEAPVDRKHLNIRLRPGSVTRLTIGMRRWVNAPTYAFPWSSGDRLQDP